LITAQGGRCGIATPQFRISPAWSIQQIGAANWPRSNTSRLRSQAIAPAVGALPRREWDGRAAAIERADWRPIAAVIGVCRCTN